MGGLYSAAMHGFVLDEMELGTRVACAIDNEACGFSALFDLQVAEDFDQMTEWAGAGVDDAEFDRWFG